jgi:hypothetical protein
MDQKTRFFCQIDVQEFHLCTESISKETCEEYHASFSFSNISYKENEGNLMVAIHKQYWQKCIPSFPLDHQSKLSLLLHPPMEYRKLSHTQGKL